MNKEKEIRFQIVFSESASERLEEIKKKSGARTKAEVIKSAIKFYDWLLTRLEENYTFKLAKDDEVKDVEFVNLNKL